MEKINFKINGMSCNSCVKGIEGSLRNLDGVVDVDINFSSGDCEIEFDGEKISKDDILKLILDMGYNTS